MACRLPVSERIKNDDDFGRTREPLVGRYIGNYRSLEFGMNMMNR